MSNVPFGFNNVPGNISAPLDPTSEDLSERLQIRFPDLTNAPPKHYGPTLQHHQLSEERVNQYLDEARKTHRFDWEEAKKNARNKVKVVPFGSSKACVNDIDASGWNEVWATEETWASLMRRLMVKLRVSMEFWHIFQNGNHINPGWLIRETIVDGDMVDLVPAMTTDLKAYLEQHRKQRRWSWREYPTGLEGDAREVAIRRYHLQPPSVSTSQEWSSYIETRDLLNKHMKTYLDKHSMQDLPRIIQLQDYHFKASLYPCNLSMLQLTTLHDSIYLIHERLQSTTSDTSRPWSIETVVRIYSPIQSTNSIDIYFMWHHKLGMRDVDFRTKMAIRINNDKVGITPTDLDKVRKAASDKKTISQVPQGWLSVLHAHFEEPPLGWPGWAAIERRKWDLTRSQVKEIRNALFGIESGYDKVSDLALMDLILSMAGVYVLRVERRLDIKVGMNTTKDKRDFLEYHLKESCGEEVDDGYESPDPKELALASLKSEK